MCIIKKVFYYEETKLPVIKYKDEIWVKGGENYQESEFQTSALL